MRLDHLLSRETAKEEIPELIPRSMQTNESSFVKGAAQAAKHENASAKTGASVAQDAQRVRKAVRIASLVCIVFRARFQQWNRD